MQLGIILTSLQDNSHIASLLGFSSTENAGNTGPRSSHCNTQLAEVLMKTVLKNLAFYTVSYDLVHANDWQHIGKFVD